VSLILSLFPGLGLLDMAFEGAGFCIVRGPDVLWGGDVRAFHPPAGVFDGVIGGPPCQSFSSLANLVRAKGHEPRFGNLIPEFERCVAEARPLWFLMENVPAAPVPAVGGYAVHNFVICNSWMDGGDGMGEEQERKRRFSFGVRGAVTAPDLRRWIRPAALLLPAAESSVRAGSGLGPTSEWERTPEEVVALVWAKRGARGSGKVKRTRSAAITAGARSDPADTHDRRGARRTLAEMCRLQGLPEDFLADAPFTMDGKRKAVANGVPPSTGRAIAGAVREALAALSR
jgi:DNA (cytosine-5)-methyltransferase 1